MRAELIARRMAAPAQDRRSWSLTISLHLLHAMPWREGLTVGFCWPYKGEYDARPLLRSLRARGMTNALPVVVQRAEPLLFRLWSPGVAMAKGPLGIPYPLGTAQADPDLLLVPLVGFGRAGDRLGYGGGYMDRTLAALEPRPLCIGVGFELCQLDSTFPQPHDVLMDAIVTEKCLRWQDNGTLQEVTAQQMRERLAELAQVRAQMARLNAHTVPHSAL
ncbi:MAG TPA: 5-formyltetrahydrofolate cyclo-ligase [Burkholderiaceae bacterium]|nr:5-formyltetrahydrofolate cyclo-ligase [Burkholderiaceae bacterium]